MCRLREGFGRLAHSMQNARKCGQEEKYVTLTSYSSLQNGDTLP